MKRQLLARRLRVSSSSCSSDASVGRSTEVSTSSSTTSERARVKRRRLMVTFMRLMKAYDEASAQRRRHRRRRRRLQQRHDAGVAANDSDALRSSRSSTTFLDTSANESSSSSRSSTTSLSASPATPPPPPLHPEDYSPYEEWCSDGGAPPEDEAPYALPAMRPRRGVQTGRGRRRRQRAATRRDDRATAAGAAELVDEDLDERIDGGGSLFANDADTGDGGSNELDDLVDDTHPIEHYLCVHDSRRVESETRGTVELDSTVTLRNFNESRRPDRLMIRVVEALMARVVRPNADGRMPDRTGFTIDNERMDVPYYIGLRPLAQNSPAVVAAAICSLTSNERLRIFEGPIRTVVRAVWFPTTTTTRTATTIKTPPPPPMTIKTPARRPRKSLRGGCIDDGSVDPSAADGRHRVTSRARSIVRVVNPYDRWCMVRAVAIGMARCRWRMQPQRFRDYCADVGGRQTRDVRRLIAHAGLRANPRRGYGVRDAERLQTALSRLYGSRYRLSIFSWEAGARLVWKGAQRAPEHEIALYLEAGHYNHIGEPRQLMNARAFCIDCERAVYPRKSHTPGCVAACRQCYRFGGGGAYPCRREPGKRRIRCADCGLSFANRDCFDYHRSTRSERAGRPPIRSICEMRYMCARCGRIVNTRDTRAGGEHKCDADAVGVNTPCKVCGAEHTAAHPYCWIQPLSSRAASERAPRVRYVWFDAETTQDEPVRIGERRVGYRHRANLIVAEVLCDACIDAGVSPSPPPLPADAVDDALRRGCVCELPRALARHGRRREFHSFDDADADPVAAFAHWLLRTGPQRCTTIVLSHNGGRFDMHLVLERLYVENVPVQLLQRGLKIYSMEVRSARFPNRHIIFKDTLNFFGTALANLPSTFGLSVADKGHFPHLYNRRCHLDVVRQRLPARRYYAPEFMSDAKRTAFLEWYAAHRRQRFHLREALLEYCRNDVAILRESTLAFRRLIREATGGGAEVDAFVVASTLARLALHIYRARWLPRNAMINAPERGYRSREAQSAIALRFFRLFEAANPGVRVRTAAWSIGEERLDDSGIRLDGVVVMRRLRPTDGAAQRPLAIEFMGCRWHGCPRCYADSRQHALVGERTADELYQLTLARLDAIRATRCYRIKVVWECELRAALARSEHLRRLYERIDVPGPLNARRHALRGGRVEPFRLYYRCADDGSDEIVYVDVVSLYPFVMKRRSFPLGDPRVITAEAIAGRPSPQAPWTRAAQNPYKGLLLVRVLPPRSLRRPLLPYRTCAGARLVFPLCAACAETRQQRRRCVHTAHERAWTAAFTHFELNAALERGYSVVSVHEVWHYDRWSSVGGGGGCNNDAGNDDNNDSSDEPSLFGGYVDAFLKLKVESSGWPHEKMSAAERRAFIDAYRELEGIELDAAALDAGPNAGRRFIAKILLNSLWGKLCQCADRSEVRITESAEAFHRLLQDPTLECVDFTHVSDELDRVVVRKRADYVQAPRTNNVPVAAFVTSHARLHLYAYIEEVERSPNCTLLYCDTDSLIYARPSGGGGGIVEGERLGEMSRELASRRIVEFVAAGPKNYGLRHTALDGSDERATLKVRGIELNYAAAQLVNFNTMRAMILAKYELNARKRRAYTRELLALAPSVERSADGCEYELRVRTQQLTRSKLSIIDTRHSTKRYRPLYTKGRIVRAFGVEPYGFVPPPTHN